MGTPDSREYDRLVDRKFRPYSLGHRMMYEKAIVGIVMDNKRRGELANVVEAGFGIGWGMERFATTGILRSYVGYEPNVDSFNYVKSRPFVADLMPENTLLLNLPYEANLGGFDHAVCIEVIEHVPMDQQGDFLAGLRSAAPRLWFSTPDITKAPKEGVRTTKEWVDMLVDAGYGEVTVDTEHWTHLFDCRP